MAAERELSVDALRTEIAGILQGADLNTLTSKKVRETLENKYKTSLSHRKQEIDDLLLKMIESDQSDHSDESEDNEEEEMVVVETAMNGEGSHKKTKKMSMKRNSPSTSSHSPKIKATSRKKKDSPKDEQDLQDDEELARKLQEEEKRRRTRSGSQVKVKEKRTPKEKKERGAGQFGAMMVLSNELASLMGETRMRRQDVVKRMWEIIKERNLSDPKNKRFTICDDDLYKVIGKKRFLTFSMLKYLKRHIKDPALMVW